MLRKGTWGITTAVYKFMMIEGCQPLDAFVHETSIYQHLKPLQGGCLADFLGHGLTFCSSRYFIALELIPGVPLAAISKPYSPEVFSAAERALDDVHDRGVLHGDLHEGNIMVMIQCQRRGGDGSLSQHCGTVESRSHLLRLAQGAVL
eukprot:GHUV01037437.1.p1 GENE.GHUV01037437.1~~GHUV01037437.1.p1  ORF type:complete len:148 (+),score=11.91 GHUV01037437.1:512-955(+)